MTRGSERISTGVCREAYGIYEKALDAGVARETARLVLPVSYYTEWYWKINLHNLLHFLSLRLDPHAQEEIAPLRGGDGPHREGGLPPIAFEAFEEFKLDSLSLSRRELKAVRALLNGADARGGLRDCCGFR